MKPTFTFNPPMLSILVANWDRARASINSASFFLENGSKFSLSVPLNRIGFCGIMESFDRRGWRPTMEVSTLSMWIFPSETSTVLSKDANKELFPAPVLPTIPI